MPFPVAFADGIYSNRGFVPEVGMTYQWEPLNQGNSGGFLGQAPCGSPNQWLLGCLTTDPVCDDCAREAVVPIQEVPAGAVDGNNRAFLTSQRPISNASLLVFVNGVEQLQGVDYSIAQQTIRFQAASTPRVGSTINVYYWIPT
jgi:hypothetical protein